MEIFYLKKSEFLSSVNSVSLNYFADGREYKSCDKKIEHLCGLFLTKFIARNVYDVEKLDIEICKNKPFFVSREIFFSISHSKDIILAAFNNSNIGVDIEYMEENRDYESILKRYGEKIENPSPKDFYRFWTLRESEIKLGCEIESLFSRVIEKKYMISCVSDGIFVSNFCVKKLHVKNKNIDLVKELENPFNIKLLSVA